MDKLIINSNDFLKDGDLIVGHVYLYKDGRVVVYLGKDDLGKYVFYELAAALYSSVDFGKLTLSHYDTQVEYLSSISKQVMQNKCEEDCIIWLKGMPKLYCEFPYISFENEVISWWDSNQDIQGLPKLQTGRASDTEPKNLFVSAKDLVPGELYYTGSLWRALYLYLGRNHHKEFCWWFVGNVDTLRMNDMKIFKDNMQTTSSNKKCKRLIDAPKDPDAYVYDDAEQLIKENYHADLSGLVIDDGCTDDDENSGDVKLSPELIERVWSQMPEVMRTIYGSTKEESATKYYKEYSYLFK